MLNNNTHALPNSMPKTVLATGLVLYKNVFEKDIIQDMEEVLSGKGHFKWSPALVGNRQRVIDYRDCLDFKFKKSNIVGTDPHSEIIKNTWQYLYDRAQIALNDYFAKRQEIKGKILRIIANRTKKKSIPKVDLA